MMPIAQSDHLSRVLGLRAAEDAVPPDGRVAGISDRVSAAFLLQHQVCPRRLRPDGSLEVAVTETSLMTALDDLGLVYDRAVVPARVSDDELRMLLQELIPQEAASIELRSSESVDGDSAGSVREIRVQANQAPVVAYVNGLITEACASSASDIHLESAREGLLVRLRLDGALVSLPPPEPRLERAVISRLKLLADLDIADRRHPQDGRIRVKLQDKELDVRVATAPTVFGESVVLRLLGRETGMKELESLGLHLNLLAALRRLAHLPHGMLLATGPTGSGKTTTLYSLLGMRHGLLEKIITIEDPVEYTLEGVTQIPVNPQAGVTFASGLRSILRQDPDVILVGEMRDCETAELAIQAALTGHVVLSTLHTNDAVGAIPRLMDFDIPPYLVAATLEGVLAQRLVRRICHACRKRYDPPPDLLDRLYAKSEMVRSGFEPTHGTGCSECRGTGFRGRTGLFELMVPTDEFRDLLLEKPAMRRLRELALNGGLVPLRIDGCQKVTAGITTVEEVLRVTET